MIATVLIVAIVRSERIADWLGRTGQRVVSWVIRRLGRTEEPDVAGSIHRFRDQLGFVIRRRGLASLGTSVVSQLAWVAVLIVALRMMGIPEHVLTPGDVFAVYALVMVITIIPLSPGGAGVPSCCSSQDSPRSPAPSTRSAITAGVFLYRLYYWFLPIPLAWVLLKVARRGGRCYRRPPS